MFTFCGYLCIFGEDPWQRINKIIEPTKNTWILFGEGPLEKSKKTKTNKSKETKPIGDPAIPMALFF